MRIFLVLILFLSSCLSALPLQDHIIDRKALCDLMITLHLDPEGDVVATTQKAWLRQKDKERWHMQELSPEEREYVLQWGEKEGIYAEWKPSQKCYSQGIILGATTGVMEKRLRYLEALREEGIRFQEVVFLTGDRPLDPHADSFLDRCQNESEAARVIWEEHKGTLKTLPVRFIALPMEGEKRPNTADTIIAWQKDYHKADPVLFISDQPFCWYQFAIIKSLLPDSILFDVAGPGVDPRGHPQAAAITLDTIARFLYAEPRPCLSH